MIFIGMPLPLFAVDDGNEYFFTNQKVGIKTRTPQASLDVNGDIQSLEIRTNNFRLDRPNAKNGMVLTLGLNGYAEWISFPVQPPTDGPDNLGNHVAEQDLQMSNKNIIDVNTISASKFNGGNFYGGRFNGDGSELKNVPSDIFIVKDNVISNNGSSSNYQNNFVIGAPHIATNDANFHTRMIFNKEKGYFRAGRAEGGEWDQGGYYSVAFGKNTISSADYSFSFGLNSQATGVGAFAGGNGSSASSNYSFALGNNTLASGNNSIALGKQSSATKDSAIAFGVSNNADGINSIAIGNRAKASQTNSIAIGTNVLSLANYGFTIGSGVNEQTPLINSIDNSLAIGFLSNQSTLFVGPSTGAATVGKVGIGTNIPQTLLDIAGKTTTEELRLTNGAQQGYVLTSIDAMGNATWRDLQEIELNQQGDNLGNHIAETDINFNGFNLVNGNEVNINKIILQENGNEANPIVTFADALTTGIYQGPEKQIAFSANGTQALVINQAGKIGVNYKNPFTELYINGNTFTEKLWANNGDPIAPSITFITDRNTGFFNPSNNNLAITTKGVEKIRIDGNGAMGIGFKNMQTKLDINGSIMIKDGTQGEGKVLTSDANGIARWELASQGSAGDNLGDHIATQDLDMATKNIVNVEKISANTLEGNLLNSTVTGGIINGSELKNVELKPQKLFALADNTKEVLAANSSETGSYVRLRIPSAVGWSEYSINDETNKQKWAIGSLGDQRPDNNGGKNTFYIFQRSNKDDINVNGYRLAITDTGNVGIGTTKATEKLHIKNGSILIDDGTQADGYVLTSDATGKGTWKSLAELSTNGDNLGDHLATQDLDMANNSIANISSLTTSSLILNDGTQADNYVLTSDATGKGTWKSLAELSTGGDNLGDHIATKDLKMGGNNIVGANNIFANYFNGDGSAIKNIQATNIVGTVAQANSSFYADEASKVTGFVNGAVILNSKILNNTVNGTLEFKNNSQINGNIFSNGNILFAKRDLSIGLANQNRLPSLRNISWDQAGTLIKDTGWVDFIADANGNNQDFGFRFYSNTQQRSEPKLIAKILGNKVEINKPLILNGNQLTIKDGTQADGYVLTSDATGKGTWKSLAELSTNGDNLGDHLATQDLDMANNSIANISSLTTSSLILNDGSQADGFVLTTDASGTARWTDPNSLNRDVTQLKNGNKVASLVETDGNFYVTNNGESNIVAKGFVVSTSNNILRRGNVPWTGVSPKDGYRIKYSTNITGEANDFLVFEKLDGNSFNPDGGIAFTNTGNDGVEEIALAIRGQGNIGIGTATPTEKLHIKDGSIKIQDGTQADGYVLTSDATGKGTWKSLEELSTNGDNLGDHIATQDLDMATKNILNVEKISANTLEGNLLNSTVTGGIINGSELKNVELKAQQLFALADNTKEVLAANSSETGSYVRLRIPSAVGWSEFSINDETNKQKWAIGSLGDQRPDNNGGKNTFYIFQRSNKDDINVNGYRLAITDTGNVGIGTTEATEKLHIKNGSILIDDGTQADGYVLTSDATGKGTWKDLQNINNKQWKLVHFQDFEANDAISGWQTNAGATVNLTSCNNTKILGGVNSLSKANIKKTFSLTGIPHTQVMIKFNYYSLDSWDDEDAVAYINNTNVWSRNLIHFTRPFDRSPTRNNRKLPNCDTGASNTSGTLSSDRVYSASGFINHNSDTLEIEFGSSLDEAPNNESYGIDNLEIYVRTVDESPRLPEALP